ncbi:MAG: stage II sporulation protein M [Planctomycetota bacterium]
MANLAETIQNRQADWRRLEIMINRVASGRLSAISGKQLAEMGDLYRAACADLSMAEQYRLSPEMVNYLHQLVGRAHNTIYRSRRFQVNLWWDMVFRDAPQQIFRDPCVHICAILFFGIFALSSYCAFNEEKFPGFVDNIVAQEQLRDMEEDWREMEFGRDFGTNLMAVAGYIQHNTSIGLECFAKGPLILPGLFTTSYNACVLGTMFGYMARPETDGGDKFLEFVTAHGPFELTAIALAAAAGLRIGVGILITLGLRRMDSVRRNAMAAIPVMTASGILFFLAACTEGMLSPSGLPYMFKAVWGMFCSTLLMFYFVVLGYPTERPGAT